MQLNSFYIPNGSIEELCTTPKTVVKVDCCLKNDLKIPAIYWDAENGCGSDTIEYGGQTLCEVPANISYAQMIAALIRGRGEVIFYALPEVGGCPTYEWSLNGEGNIESTDEWGRTARYTIPGSEYVGCNPVVILVQDRCANTDTINVLCCEYAPTLYITYTSLAMSCGEEQDFSANGGCPPYSWSLSGGGSLSNTEGGSTTYTAPATNPNCSLNPTITLEDCCGLTAEVKLAVNCYVSDLAALTLYNATVCSSCQWYASHVACGGYPGYVQKLIWWAESYKCNNILMYSCYTACGSKDCCGTEGSYCFGDDSTCTLDPCYTAQCGGCPASPCPCLVDVRTAGMKTGGCCPLNPITGLPY